jgi:predicted nuclease of predicted toxin-antitoxin system
MKFLVDAQLPVRLSSFLVDAGHDSIHSSALVRGNRTPDADICQHADAEHRTVITKDRDFRDSHLLHGSPRSLLIVSTGNISNPRLLSLFEHRLEAIVQFLGDFRLVEVTGDALIAHATPDAPLD